MSHSNRTSLPDGYLWGWPNTGERRPVSGADPRMEIQPPGDGSYMPNVTTTPPPPPVWMASAPQSSNALQNPYAAGGTGNPLMPVAQPRQAGNAPWPGIMDYPMTAELWGRLTPEQRALYESALQAHQDAQLNQRGQAPQRFDNPYWAEKYPGF